MAFTVARSFSESSSDGEFHDENSQDFSDSGLQVLPNFLKDNCLNWISIQLSHNNFVALPPEIGCFENLVFIDISNNGLSVVGEEITNLRKLKTFIARNNLLDESSIPKDFGLLTVCLETLNLSGNCFTNVPLQFTELSLLKHLYLGGNKIIEIPSTVKYLSSLEVLYLGGNRLTEVPAELGYLQKLSSLVLCDNHLHSLPPTLINLRKLQSLSLHNNQLSTLPTEIVSLNLIELSLRNNPLVARFVQDLVIDPPSLLELAGRVVKIEKVSYEPEELPKHIVKYLQSAQRCVNPQCKGVFFSSKVENVKFVDFCGKYRLPLLQYLCSPKCRYTPMYSDSESDTEDAARSKMKKVLLG